MQRYLAAKSVDEARTSLLISAYWKIPLQAMVLLVGVLVFVFYQFQRPPLLFNPAHEKAVRAAQPAAYGDLEARYAAIWSRARRRRASSPRRDRGDDAGANVGDADIPRTERQRDRRSNARRWRWRRQVTGQPSKDVNYIIPRFVLDHLPIGLAGIVHRGGHRGGDERDLRRAQLALDDVRDRFLPALDSRRSVRRAFPRGVAGRDGVLGIVRLRRRDVRRESRIAHRGRESIRIVLLRIDPRRVPAGDDSVAPRAAGAFVGLIAGMAVVGAVNFGAPKVAFLWHNVIGAVTVVVVGMLISAIGGKARVLSEAQSRERSPRRHPEERSDEGSLSRQGS